MFRVDIDFKYRNGSYKRIPYYFKTEEEYDAFFIKASENHLIRKIIGTERMPEITEL
jgi:hypothetical protein